MSEEFGLTLRSDSREIKGSTKDLDNLAASGRRAERSTDGLGGAARRTGASFKGLATLITAAIGALATSKLVSATRQFEMLNAQLKTSTGSAENAAVAFDALKDFASTTPYALEQSVAAFNKLVNLGLTPSERALRSYGDTASAMGKDLEQLVEAVADAATGEFERLKEFGIKSRVEGDKVRFTFRGVTTEVGNNAAAIEEFLIGIGETNFAGAMQAQMETLNGAISNLGDSWDILFATIGNAGVGGVIEDSIRFATEAIQELTVMIESGQLQASIAAVGSKFEGWIEDVERTVQIIHELLGISSEDVGEFGGDLGNAFSDLPENVRYYIQRATIEITAFIEKVGSAGQALAEALNPFDDVSATEAIQRHVEELDVINEARESSISWIEQERAAALQSFDEQISKAQQLRAEYDANRAAEAAQNEGKDRLASFGVAPTKEEGELDPQQQKRLEKLQQEFASELELENLHHQKKLEMFAEYAELERLSEEEKNAKLAEIEQEHQENLTQIRLNGMKDWQTAQKQGFAAQAYFLSGELNSIVSMFGKGNDKLVKVAQITGAAQAFIATLTGQAEALKLGFPLGLIAAAKIGAAGFGFVAAIKGSGKSSSGGRRGSGSAAPTTLSATNLQAEQQAPKNQIVDFRFATGGRRIFRDEEVAEMIGSIQERIKDGDNRLGNVEFVS